MTITDEMVERAAERLFSYLCPSIRMTDADREYYGGGMRAALLAALGETHVVVPRDTKLSWARPLGATFNSMQKHVWETGLASQGDTILVWVNEGDFWGLSMRGVELEEFKNPDAALASPERGSES